ncbi:MAG: AAA family ATPase [candidate division WOR-3 bacterium]|nr:AAA family ATPase [candidate division WOR-3 bacterium]
MRILITGKPKAGKTTLIKKIIKEFSCVSWCGFYTEEVIENNNRVGFNIVTTDGQKVLFAHKDIASPYYIGKYRVNLEALETVGINSLTIGIKNNKPLIIDEVGKMELLSKKFQNFIKDLFSTDYRELIIATIPITPLPFLENLKKLPGQLILNIDNLGFNTVLNKTKESIKTCYALIIK